MSGTNKTAPTPAAPGQVVAPPAAGTTRIRWIYHPAKAAMMGKVADLPTAEAARLKGENRVAYVDPTTPVDLDADGNPLPAPVAGSSAPAAPAEPAK